MPCTVKKTFEAARDTGNSLVDQVKANQQTLHEAIEAICAAETPIDSAETVDSTRHDRREHRHVETFEVTGRLGAGWDGLIATAARVTRLTWHTDTRTGLWRETCEAALYASQIRLSAATIGEDQSRIRAKPAHFARLRSFALNILRANATTNVSKELYLNALNPNHAMSYRLKLGELNSPGHHVLQAAQVCDGSSRSLKSSAG